MQIKKINYGIIGAGHLGTYHVQQLSKIDSINLVGVYDVVRKNAKTLSQKFHIKPYDDLCGLLDLCDAISITTPASCHFEIAVEALKKNCHLFIEKPITNSFEDSKKLITLNERLKKIIQVGHIERFNSAFVGFLKTKPNPLFIESHRLSPYGERGLDVAVVLDLMIHDIDLILSCVDSDVLSINASGACVVSDLFDLANARIEFQNGCVANITASRISTKQMRQMRIFEKNSYSVLDFQNQSYNRWIMKDRKNIKQKTCSLEPVNALYEELKSFVGCITDNLNVVVNEIEASKALELAIKIQKYIEK